ncbi:MAG: cupin domain-containing protein [Gammaproteobacteria bacterium]
MLESKGGDELSPKPSDSTGRSTEAATPGYSLIDTSAQSTTGLCLVDVMGGEGALQSLRVKPAVFLKLLDRLEHPMVAHHKRRLGTHSYFAYCGGFIIETSTRRPLGFPGTSRQFERQERVPVSEANTRQPSSSVSSGPIAPIKPSVGGRSKPRFVELPTEDNYYVTEWWNSADDPALSVARLRIEPGVTTRAYRLRGVTERYLFLAGHGLVEIDGQNREVGPGDGVLIKGGSWRCITNMGERDLGLLSICRPRFKRMEHQA